LSAAIALLITSLVFFALGFPLNAFSERKALNLKQSSILLVLFYVFAPVIHTIPYLYLGVFEGSILDQLFNSWFETSSATSTTGLTLQEETISTLPKSLILARGINEWVGGIGIIFIVLAYLYPSEILSRYGRVLGIEKFAKGYKGSFMLVLLIYGSYTFFFSAILMLQGIDAFTAFHTVFTVFSTTGLTIVNVLTLPMPVVITITVLMLFSAFSFIFHFQLLSYLSKMWRMLFKRNWKTAYSNQNWKQILNTELKLYLALLVIFSIALWSVTGLSPFRAFFHTVDFSTTVGLNVVNFDLMGDTGKVILVMAMIIGPCAFSIGGGIRVLRFYILGKDVLAMPQIFLTRKMPQIKIDGIDLEVSEIIIHALIASLFIIASFLVALILSYYEYSFVDALVESVSAITTTGDSPKVLTPELPAVPKFFLGVLMIIGRIEILPIFVALSRQSDKPESSNAE
jgi:trk system potassium uptake protein TrkH